MSEVDQKRLEELDAELAELARARAVLQKERRAILNRGYQKKHQAKQKGA